MMLEKNPDAARLGVPGRTQIVGRRMAMPSTKPRRAWSDSSNSIIAFCVP